MLRTSHTVKNICNKYFTLICIVTIIYLEITNYKYLLGIR